MIGCKMDNRLLKMMNDRLERNEELIRIRLERNTRHRDNLILDKEELEIELTKLCKKLMLIQLVKRRRSIML